MMTSITAQRTAVIDPGLPPAAWSRPRVGVTVWGSACRKLPAGGRERPDCWGMVWMERQTVKGWGGEKKKRVLGIWLQVPPCSVAPLKHTITQPRAIIRQREKKRGREADRAQTHFEEHYTEQKECFYQSCDYCRSLSALNQPPWLSFLSLLCHSRSACSEHMGLFEWLK